MSFWRALCIWFLFKSIQNCRQGINFLQGLTAIPYWCPAECHLACAANVRRPCSFFLRRKHTKANLKTNTYNLYSDFKKFEVPFKVDTQLPTQDADEAWNVAQQLSEQSRSTASARSEFHVEHQKSMKQINSMKQNWHTYRCLKMLKQAQHVPWEPESELESWVQYRRDQRSSRHSVAASMTLDISWHISTPLKFWSGHIFFLRPDSLPKLAHLSFAWVWSGINSDFVLQHTWILEQTYSLT